MRSQRGRIDFILRAAILLGALLFLVGAHAHDSHGGQHSASMSSNTSAHPALQTYSAEGGAVDNGPSYFTHPAFSSLMYSHIAFMVIAWVFVLPPAIALSVARARHTFHAFVVFTALNGLGLLTGAAYKAATPDLYPHNVHGPLGWLLSTLVTGQAMFGVLRPYRRLRSSSSSSPPKLNEDASSLEQAAFIPVSVDALAEHDRCQHRPPFLRHTNRFSRDSGHCTESVTSPSLPSPTRPLAHDEEDREQRNAGAGADAGDLVIHDEDIENAAGEDAEWRQELEKGTWRRPRKWADRVASAVACLIPEAMWRVCRLLHDVADRLILPLGFVALATGVVVYGGIFRGKNIFNGLAHFIKGGIFVWYGFLTLGRWMGCFADFGWAWNVKPDEGANSTTTTTMPIGDESSSAHSRGRRGDWRRTRRRRSKAGVPSAEFVESFVIFLYGASNVFLEHLAAWGKAWTARDLEHVSISVLFFGGGLCGMLVESRRIRELLNAPITSRLVPSMPVPLPMSMARPLLDQQQEPRTYRFSLNPLPALVILLLGLMMSAHHQSSMEATMVHKQWGMLFVGFALARAVTYVMLYLAPPSSVLPSRPPSELVAAFCLIAGGLIFMASNRDTVHAMQRHQLHTMFVFTVTMGATALFMAWAMLVVVLKGWALQQRLHNSGQ